MSSDAAVTVRTVYNSEVGFGHLRRCMTLAAELEPLVGPATFMILGETGVELAESNGLRAVKVRDPNDVTWASNSRVVVVDDYDMEADSLAACAQRSFLVVVDDLANRELPTNALVVNASPSPPSYPVDALLGSEYALLRPQFRGLAKRTASTTAERVLVTLGGGDQTATAADVCQSVRRALPSAQIEVLVGPGGSDMLQDVNVTIHHMPPDVSSLMSRADLAVSAGGQTTYELAAAGVPTLAIVMADNQRANVAALAAVPTLERVEVPNVADAVTALAADRERRQVMTAAGQALIDGHGARRVAQIIAERLRT